jgi:Holliday junction resolvase RusA-like endonuclease
MREITIEFPGAPNLDLSPNRRDNKGWRSRHAAVAELKTLNFDKLAESLAPTEPLKGDLEYEAEICWPPGQRMLDFDGAVGLLKAYVDLLERAKWMKNDRQIKRGAVEQLRDPETQYVQITVREVG